MGPTAQLVISLGKTTAQILAEFSPIPGLYPAVEALVGIIELCEGVSHNRNAARCLRDRCHHVVIALRDGCENKLDGSMAAALDSAIDCLVDIQTRMDSWVHVGKFQGFTRQKAIKAEIERCFSALNDCLMKFQLASQIEIHSWQAIFATSAKHDHLELMDSMSELKDIQVASSTKVEENLEMTRQMMKMMQEFMSENKKSAERTHHGISKNLWKLQCQSGELMPDLHLKSGEVRRVSDQPIKWTNAMDIYEGIYLEEAKVYIKCLRVVDANEDSLRRFKREVKIWAEIWRLDRGEYILPFYGFAQNDGPFPYMVSPWQKHGHVLEYVKAYDSQVDYDRLIKRIALGIHFLHCTMKPPVVHGVIRAENIYINDEGNPLLADFGVSQIVTDISGIPFTQSHGVIQSYRWFAPEVCIGEGSLSPSSDIYAYGMTVLEVLTHQQPYSHIRHATEVVIKSSAGEFPRRPTDSRVIERGLDDKLWTLLARCWSKRPDARPTIKQVIHGLH
ncbi:Serine/threonine-protein kinase STY17 [Hypsizygus marmoreus]|uniref:Serine/threonine-protein kinase STY17 n=1 Tax=Hypsizygus marmoreus TaxID=39966 RepID=A0A369JRF8_HYPMA|nr:Serine/threonine-protein kinase STY17 [Hypsizygus marmoreus]